MTAPIPITAGRTALRALLVAVVVTAGIAGTVGTVAAEPMDGKGDDPFPPSLYASLDGKGNDVYPPPARYSLDGKGNDVLTTRFPIDNVTVDVDSSRLMLAFPIDNVTLGVDSSRMVNRFPIDNVTALQNTHRTSFDVPTSAGGMDPYARALPQDMDPY